MLVDPHSGNVEYVLDGTAHMLFKAIHILTSSRGICLRECKFLYCSLSNPQLSILKIDIDKCNTTNCYCILWKPNAYYSTHCFIPLVIHYFAYKFINIFHVVVNQAFQLLLF